MQTRTFALALVGSRGDVQPGLAVAAGLRERGHRVELGVAPNLLPMARRLGLDAIEIGVDSRELLTSSLVRKEMRSADPRRRARALREVAAYGWTELREGIERLSVKADVVVTGLLGQEMGAAVAEAREIAFAALHYCPVRANSVVPLVSFGGKSARVRSSTWRAGEAVRWALTRKAENEHRKELGLPPAVVDLPSRLRDRGATEVQAYDAALVPGLAGEWGNRRPLVGSLDLPWSARPAENIDGELESWLAGGPPPVYVGFGSMPVPDPAAVLDSVTRMCDELGVRALVVAGWSGFERPADARLFVTPAVEHAEVLPKCSVVVHHGGAGTTAAVVRAGKPSVVCPFSADQPMWAAILRGHGIGTSVRFSRLDAASLTAAVAAMSRPEVRARAERFAERMTPVADAVSAATGRLEAAV
ncbi:glycosyltransferase family 1 protein [Amycolatopsis acidicola]|uniref:Glycosyltransferase family 1 protein n=1 Tax=Amycolatopsis acidicola TaxID=2596893 RepID=A0A5N0V6I0_9PSEU|nr:glycosyltransferase [Amycolatopsis acidicola]KAA9162026.1 glycosyltransferase family 1 protein [Amycolatopsis acidicola]